MVLLHVFQCMEKMRNYIYWILAVIVTLAAIIYQRATGPTYDKDVSVTIEGTVYTFTLPRSHGGKTDCEILLKGTGPDMGASLEYRRYPTRDFWTKVPMKREENHLAGTLPHQPPAGKLEYRITLEKKGKVYPLNEGLPVVIRFKGKVPVGILIPHIILMFMAMFLSTLAGIMALFRHRKYVLTGQITLAVLFTGGLILGPLMQWYAFHEPWAGIPFGWDLTDNKTLVAFLFWTLAVCMNRKKRRPAYTLAAAVVMLIVYSIPHSLFGSELDPETGEIIQGWINRLFLI
jgi:hypothetical protein